MIDALNRIGENVWAVVLVVIGALVGVASVKFPVLFPLAQAIAGGGLMAFKGGKSQAA